MECFLQYLDDLDDLFYAVALIGERIRRILRFLIALSGVALIQGLGLFLAIEYPPIAVASGSLMLVMTLYYGVVHHGPGYSTTA
jgi:hypothetical protein